MYRKKHLIKNTNVLLSLFASLRNHWNSCSCFLQRCCLLNSCCSSATGKSWCWAPASSQKHYFIDVIKVIIFSWHHKKKIIEEMHFKTNYCLKIRKMIWPCQQFQKYIFSHACTNKKKATQHSSKSYLFWVSLGFLFVFNTYTFTIPTLLLL